MSQRRGFLILSLMMNAFSNQFEPLALADVQRVSSLCPTVVIEESPDLHFSELEKRLVCGEGGGHFDQNKISGHPWGRIPPAQGPRA